MSKRKGKAGGRRKRKKGGKGLLIALPGLHMSTTATPTNSLLGSRKGASIFDVHTLSCLSFFCQVQRCRLVKRDRKPPNLNGFWFQKVFWNPGSVTNFMVNLNCCQHIQLQMQIRPYFLAKLTMFFSSGGRSSCCPSEASGNRSPCPPSPW